METPIEDLNSSVGRSNSGDKIAAPNKIWISLTNKCNLFCPHCLPDSRVAKPNEMIEGEVLSVIDQAIDLGIKRIAFTGGEPTLNPSIKKFVARAAGGDRRVYLESNATRLRGATLGEFADLGVSILNISLDGASSETHDTFRGAPGLFEKTFAAIREAIMRGIEVRVYCVVSQVNIHEAFNLVEIMQRERLSLGVLTFSLITPLGRANHNQGLNLSATRWRAFCKRLEEIRPEFEATVGPLRYHTNYLTSEGFKAYERELDYDFKCIARRRDYIYVDPEGNTHGCVLSSATASSLGNLRDTRLEDIWARSNGWNVFEKAETCQGCPIMALSAGSKKDPRVEEAEKEGLKIICPMTQYPQIEEWFYKGAVS